MKRSGSEKNDSHIVSKSPRLLNSGNDEIDSLEIRNQIKVCVRIRPLKSIELENNTKSIIEFIDKSALVFDPYKEDNRYEYHGKRYKEIGKKANKNLKFNFDRVFNNDEDNLTVYSETTKNLVTSLLAGYNCSVFAYGSTGSGKTHTMLGSSDDPGVVFCTIMDLYKHIEEKKDRNLELKISYFEIYNEVIYDLLDPKSGKPLSVLENVNKSINVQNLYVYQPKNAADLIEQLEFGNKNRKQHPTDANSESSRSHAVFQITLQRKDFSNDQRMAIQVSKMSLIDLAGSERATNAYKTYRSNSLHREGGNINKSLLSLGNCIHALTSKKKNVYVPYRSSKLTLILRDSLGGNCQTVMIATVSPSANQYEESHSTLIYAERAQGIQLNAHKNSILVDVKPRDYKYLEQQLEKYKNHEKFVPDNPINASMDSLAKLNSVKENLDHLFEQRIELRSELLKCEHNLKLLDFRSEYRKYENERLKLLNILGEENQSDHSKGLHSIYEQTSYYSNLKSSIEKEVEENENKIMKFENDLMANTDNDMIVQTYFEKNHTILEKKEMKFNREHQRKMMKEFFSKYYAFEEFDGDFLDFIYKYKSYDILNDKGKLSDEMDEKFRSIVHKIKGKKNVIWRDDIDPTSINRMKKMLQLFSLPVYDVTLNNTPEIKRNLVAIRDITPRLLRPIQNRNVTPIHIGQMNHQNLGNTINISRNVAIHSSGQKQQSIHYRDKPSQRYYNNNNNISKYYNQSLTSIDNHHQPWPPSSVGGGSQRKQRHGYRNNKYNYNGGVSNFQQSNSRPSEDNFGYNQNIRPRFRV
ncbi:Kinesin-like protein kif18a [Dermatophagoides farinae]|uniref:Kinesin-like protein n=1 Tax=Dermatophagoides farinae TaxID=6954 RepID=A0A922HZJ0_DERFA|nr:Kinesin-like protein kif18a [Dermatophagoides farinae]